MRVVTGLTAAATAAVTALVWWTWRHVGGWDGVLVWVLTAQQGLHRQLTSALQAVEAGGVAAGAALIGLSLLYGVLHAAGPGHGKAVITTYLGTHAVQLRRGVALSVLAALTQGVVAVVLVEAVELAVAVWGLPLRRAHALGGQVESASFVLVAALGTVLAARSALALWRLLRPTRQVKAASPSFLGAKRSAVGASAQGVPLRAYCADCGPQCHHHGPSRAQLNQPLSWRGSAAVVLAVGLRPCTGAVLVLLAGHALGLRASAIAAVFAMSLGTAATVAALAALAVSARQHALRLLARRAAPRTRALAFNALGALGGVTITALGVGLLQQALRASAHPLL